MVSGGGRRATRAARVAGLRAHHALEWAAAERDNRYTAPTVFIPEFGLLPVQLAQARARDRSADFRYGPEA